MTSLDNLLQQVEPLTVKVINWVKADYKKQGLPFTKFDAEYTKLSVQYKLTSSFTKYVKEDSKISDVKARISMGKIIARMVVEQDGESHNFETEVILAGGYNIQCLHARFLVHTSLPNKFENKNMIKAMKSKMTKLDKYKENRSLAETYKIKLADIKDKIETLESMSKEDIINENVSMSTLYNIDYDTLCTTELERKLWIEGNKGITFDTEQQWNDYKETTVWTEYLQPQHVSRIKMNNISINRLTKVVKDYENKADKTKKEMRLKF